jgi:hypothetical protein
LGRAPQSLNTSYGKYKVIAMSKVGVSFLKRMKVAKAKREKAEKKVPKEVRDYVEAMFNVFDLGLAMSFAVKPEEYEKITNAVYKPISLKSYDKMIRNEQAT